MYGGNSKRINGARNIPWIYGPVYLLAYPAVMRNCGAVYIAGATCCGCLILPIEHIGGIPLPMGNHVVSFIRYKYTGIRPIP
mgnify:FL=1